MVETDIKRFPPAHVHSLSASACRGSTREPAGCAGHRSPRGSSAVRDPTFRALRRVMKGPPSAAALPETTAIPGRRIRRQRGRRGKPRCRVLSLQTRMGLFPLSRISCIQTRARRPNSPALKDSSGSTRSIQWWRTLARCRQEGLAVPMSMCRYICRESADMISPSSSCASASARSVLPTAVGPASITSRFSMSLAAAILDVIQLIYLPLSQLTRTIRKHGRAQPTTQGGR